MKIRIGFATVLCVLCLALPLWAAGEQSGPAPSVKAAGDPTDAAGSYTVGPGDLLEISVWKDESLTRAVVVLPDGRVSFPLIGQIDVAGKTLAQLKRELDEKLGRYVPDAVLNLDIKQVNSQIIYVLGRVNTPGRFVLNTNVNVMQALATAGGLNPFAKRSRITIFRDEGGKTALFKFDYDDFADGKGLEKNIQLKRGDIIVVP
jgi:polysaccharide export outer membrane protein